MHSCCATSDSSYPYRFDQFKRSTTGRWFGFGLLAGAALINACDQRQHHGTLLEKYGYIESIGARPIVQRVINNCNALLSPQLAIRLEPAWEVKTVAESRMTSEADSTPTSSPVRAGSTESNETQWARNFDPGVSDFLNPTPYPVKLRIPVDLIRADSLSNKEISFVPTGEKRIFINAPGIKYIAELFHSDKLAGDDVASNNEVEIALTLIVLHEIGHIVNGDAGSFVEEEFPTWEEVSGSMSNAKNHELKADLFAVEQINKARARSFPVTLLPLGAEIAGFVGSASFRTGMSLAAADPSTYVDKSSTHPNFYLRLLVMSEKLYPNPFSANLLKSFVQERQSRLLLKAQGRQ